MFIVIEGIEGAGKSSIQLGLERHFSSLGRKVLLTREPGGSELGKEIRQILLSKRNQQITTTSELLLFAADRAEHVESVIRPALAADYIVICDRFIYSTLAYQGFGRGLSLDLINQLNSVATNSISPDAVLLLDLPVETGLSRARARSERESADSWTRFEAEEIAFHQRIREGFLTLAKQHNDIFQIIDASQDPESVLTDSITKLTSCLDR